MLQDWETDVLYPSKVEKICDILDELGAKYEVHSRGRLEYIIIKNQSRETIEKLFNVEG